MWLLTPFADSRTAEEMRYILAHGRTRSVVERTVGLLKSRWSCLDASGGKLYHPEKVTCIILACGVLQNIALRHGIEMDAEIRMDRQEPLNPPSNGEPAPADAVRRRRQLIQSFVVRNRMPDNIQNIGFFICVVENVQQLHYVNKSKPCVFFRVQSQSAQPMCSTRSGFAGLRRSTVYVDADVDGPSTPVAKHSPSLLAPAGL
uniref:DDE Tnp4 domain-containing protein n=1 Tax=Hucho hucho TaxID=62062 RepID=A0A4W5K4W4_9TELE